MPIVISHHSKTIRYLPSKDHLSETLWHSNFDGEEWAVGDLIVFEDGGQAVIEIQQDAHVWSESEPAELEDVLGFFGAYEFKKHYNSVGIPLPIDGVQDWDALFQRIEDLADKQRGCLTGLLGCGILVVLIGATLATLNSI